MIDVKKLTSYFLVLAGIVSLIALEFSSPGLSPRFGNAPAAKTSATAKVPKNAFVLAAENLPLALRRNLAGAETNITKAAGENLAQVITGLNPYGPQTIDGQTGLVLPTTTVLVGYLAMEGPQFKLSDLWVSPDDEQIVLAPSADAASTGAYKEGFRNALKATIASDGYLSAAGSAAAAGMSQEFLNVSALVWSAAIQKLKTLSTPAPFTEFQKSFLAYLEDQRNVLFVAGDLNDPLKSLRVLNSGIEVKQRFASDFAAVIRARAAIDPSLVVSRSTPSVWTNFFAALAIPAANAQGLAGVNPEDKCGKDFASNLNSGFLNLANTLTQVPVFDKAVVGNTSRILGVLLFDCQSRIMTQEVKKKLIDMMNKQTLQTIQNDGGNFITDYPEYFGDASIRAATQARRELSSETCPEFQSYIDAAIFSPDNVTGIKNDVTNPDLNNNRITKDASGNGAGSNTLGSFGASNVNGVGNGCSITSNTDVNAYYNDFNADPAAWDDYFSLLLDPSDNLFGSWAASHDKISGRAAGAAAGAQAQSVANGGYKSDVNCLHYSTDQSGNQICDEQKIVTPGSTAAAEEHAAVTSGYSFVENASNLTQLDSAVADALGTQLRQHPDQGLYSLAVNTGNSLASVCQNLAPPSYAASIPSVNAAQGACNSIVGQIIGQFNKYLSLIQNIGSILGGFF